MGSSNQFHSGVMKKLLLLALKPSLAQIKHLWVDRRYEREKLIGWMREENNSELEIVSRICKKFELLPRRWIVKPSFDWLNRSDLLSKDN